MCKNKTVRFITLNAYFEKAIEYYKLSLRGQCVAKQIKPLFVMPVSYDFSADFSPSSFCFLSSFLLMCLGRQQKYLGKYNLGQPST